MARSRSMVAIAVVALLLVTGLGVRHVVLEGEAVVRTLRQNQRLQLAATADRLRDAIATSEREVLRPLRTAWRSPTDLFAAVRQLQATAPPPLETTFVLGPVGEVLFPDTRTGVPQIVDLDAADAAADALAAAAQQARDAAPAVAIADYRAFLDDWPAPAPEPQMRPQAWLALARLHLERHDVEAAAVAVLALETELADSTAALDPALGGYFGAHIAELLPDLGAAATALQQPLAALRRQAAERRAAADFERELRDWLGRRLHLEHEAVDRTGGGEPALAVTVTGTPRRFVTATVRLGADRLIVGYEIDRARLIDEVLVPRLPGVGADGSVFGLVASASDAELTTPLGPAVPDLHLAMTFHGPDPATAAARARQWMLGSLISAALLLGVGAIALMRRHARRELAVAQLRSDFVTGMSHELRTPLALIQAVVETLQLGHVRSDDERDRYLATMARECRRLAAMIANVLDFGRIERGEVRYAIGPCEVAPMLQGLLETYGSGLREQGLETALDVAPDLPVVLACPDALGRAVMNLVDNAAKYAADGGTIEISAEHRGDRVGIVVADRGPGLDPAELPRLFESFRRGRDVHERGIRGAGLGLWLVRQSVEAMGGRVAAANREGGGATFSLLMKTAEEPR